MTARSVCVERTRSLVHRPVLIADAFHVLACTFRCIALECRCAATWSDAKSPGEFAARVCAISCTCIRIARICMYVRVTMRARKTVSRNGGRELTTWRSEVSCESMANSLPAVINATSWYLTLIYGMVRCRAALTVNPRRVFERV